MKIANLLASAIVALSLPAPTLAQEAARTENALTEVAPAAEAVPTKIAPTNAAPTEAAPAAVRHFTLGVATQEYFVALGAQLVSVGVLAGAAALATTIKDPADATPRPSGLAYGALLFTAPLLAPAASACLLRLFEDRPEAKFRSGLRAWLVGMGATFFAELIGGVALYAAYSQNAPQHGRTGVIVGSIAAVLLPSILEVVAFEGGREAEVAEPPRLSLLPFLTKGGGGVGLAGAF